MPYIESFSEFKERQGCETFTLPGGAGILFANGARAIADPFGRELHQFAEPPVDRWELLRAKRAFVAAKLERWTQDLHTLRNSIQNAINGSRSAPMYIPPPSEQNLTNLANLRRAVRDLEQDLAKIDSELWESPQAVLQRERRRQEQEMQDQISQRQQQLNEVMNGYIPPTTEGPDPFKQAIVQENARLEATLGIMDVLNKPKAKSRK